jgi:hypothetical protein
MDAIFAIVAACLDFRDQPTQVLTDQSSYRLENEEDCHGPYSFAGCSGIDIAGYVHGRDSCVGTGIWGHLKPR